jgi:hypothetical protein
MQMNGGELREPAAARRIFYRRQQREQRLWIGLEKILPCLRFLLLIRNTANPPSPRLRRTSRRIGGGEKTELPRITRIDTKMDQKESFPLIRVIRGFQLFLCFSSHRILREIVTASLPRENGPLNCHAETIRSIRPSHGSIFPAHETRE